MQEEDKAAFFAKLTEMSEIYGRPLSEPGLVGYWNHLRQYTWDAIELACKYAIVRCKFMPTPADIIEQIEIQPPDYVALPEPEVDPEETRRCLRLAGIAAVAMRCGLQPNTPEWDQFIVDHENASDKERAILQTQIKMGKIKPDEFKSMPDIIKGVLGDKV